MTDSFTCTPHFTKAKKQQSEIISFINKKLQAFYIGIGSPMHTSRTNPCTCMFSQRLVYRN